MKLPVQFHENAAVIAWWRARFGPVLRWQVPARRRAILAISPSAHQKVTNILMYVKPGQGQSAF